MSFDMNQCKKGDKLVCRSGEVVEYFRFDKLAGMYPHEVKYASGVIGNRTNTGICYITQESGKDIIGFYEEEKNMNTFDIKDLKTGYRITFESGWQYIVFLNTPQSYREDCTDFIVAAHGSCSWEHLSGVNFDQIVKVEMPDHPYVMIKPSTKSEDYKTIWERPAKETPEQIKQRELMEKYEAVKKEFEELGKQIGVNK